MLKVKYESTAEKYLKKLDRKTKERIENAVIKYAVEKKGDIKRLKGSPVRYRLRVGKYRIIFKIEGDFMIISKIDSRGDVYKESVEVFRQHIEKIINRRRKVLEKLK